MEESHSNEEKSQEDQLMEDEESERGRPSTPKWWRPPIPPETYKWEEVRRQRQKGGYPWTHLDKEEEIDADDYLDENLYEPVNPPPLYGNESYLSKDLQQVPQSAESPIDIPPEIDIITSEGLDGLDKPDPHDHGFDGDREWQNASENEHSSGVKSGIRGKSREARSATPKSVGFSPETITHESPAEPEDQEVPAEEMETEGDVEPGSSKAAHSHHGRRQTPFDILKSKAANAAEHVKEKIKLAIPVRPRLNQWQGVKKSKKRRKLKKGQEEEEGEQEVPEDVEMKEAEEGAEAAVKEEPEESTEVAPQEEAENKEEKSEPDAEEKSSKEEAEDEKKKKKAEEKLQQQREKEEKEKKKLEEKQAKQKAAEEAKKAKLEEKLAKAREAEEARQAKAEEEKKKQQEKEEAARKAAEAKKEEEAKKAAEKLAKEEEARKIAEAKKAEEEARKAAEKAKKEEEEARKAAEKAKKEEEAKKALEAKKAEEEAKKAAEKAKREEEQARKAAEKAKADEEKRLAAEKAKQEEDERKAKEAELAAAAKVEDTTMDQPMDTSEVPAEEGEGQEPSNLEDGEAMEVAPPTTPSGTTKRRYIRHRRQLPEIPNPITALKNQVEDFIRLKRSRTPPRRQVQRKHRRSRSADASRSPPRDPEEGSEKADEEQEAEKGEEEDEAAPEQAPSEAPVTTKEDVKSTPQKESEGTQQASAAPSASESKEASVAPTEDSTEAAPVTSGGGTGTVTRRRQPAAKEKLDKIGQQLKGFGAKSLDIASQASKGIGKTMKVVGKDLQKLGSKAMEEMKSKPEPQQESKPQVKEPEEVVEDILPPQEEIAPPQRTFRFRRRGQSQEEADEEMERAEQEHLYENANEAGESADPFSKNRLLGTGARDWESPHERAHSRDVSEEPYSGNASARDSPPGSSLASSTFAQVRRTGVLEEIDSDEFFLRERGISEGEDEEEVNRFLVEELRQAFRPTMSNALAGFDMQPPLAPPPPRPERAPRKPPRKDKDATIPSMYQTFPPERPKRKQPQGYISKFMKETEGEEDDMGSNEEVRGSSDDMREEEVEENESIQLVKEKLSELDRDLEQEEPKDVQSSPSAFEEYEDDGRYEPINDGPVKPTRTKRKKPRRPPTPPSFYYNTIAGNEWHREMAELAQDSEPTAPTRKRRDSGKSASLPPSGGEGDISSQPEEPRPEVEGTPAEGLTFTLSFPVNLTEGRVTTGTSEAGTDDTGDYVDEAGYAIVQKDRDVPRTIPRKKKKRAKEGEQGQGDQTGAFFSLPRSSPRAMHIVPPSRPNRTYSTLKPRRPPRSKSGSRQNLENRSPVGSRREGDEPRPSTAIGIMQGRPLPPPPRPQRSPAPYNDLDQTSIERSVGVQHYANFDEIEARTLEEDLNFAPRVTEMDRACQTDPVPEDEFVVGLSESPLLESSRIRTASPRPEETRQHVVRTSSPLPTTTGDVSSSIQAPPSNTQTNTETFPPNPSPSFAFPTRLHLEQLEVDFLRVNDLCAQTIKVDSLQTSQLEVNSMSAAGPANFSRIETQTLTSDEVNCNRLTSDSVELSSVPPSSFYKLSSPEPLKPGGSEQELCLKTEEKEEAENESACSPEFPDTLHNLMDNVNSTNDIKSSHVAEKILDKQLNVSEELESESAEPKSDQHKDESAGTLEPSSPAQPPQQPLNVPTELNDLNQEPSKKEEPETNKLAEDPVQVLLQQQLVVDTAPSPPQRPQRSTTQRAEPPSESREPQDDSDPNVVVGSYTLPYSYMSPQSPALNRNSSLRRSLRSSEARKPSSPTPRDEPHVAFGHTSVAQGDVLSVKLSIPVEQMPTGRSAPSGRSQPPPSSPTQLQDSATSQAEPQKKEAQQKKPPAESTPPPGPVAGPSTQVQRQSSAAAAESEDDGFLGVSFRLGRAVFRFTMRALQAMADYIDTASSEDPAKAEQQRANMQVLMCLVLVLVVGLILATARSGPYISPRWEFLMPPPDL